MKKALVDTNVIMDIACRREPFYDDSAGVFTKIDKNKLQGYVSASIVTDVFYLLQKDIGKENALSFLKDLLKIVDVLAVDKEVILKALYSGSIDFEDSVQTHVALQNGLDIIVTRNVKDYDTGKNVRVLTPHELMKEMV